MKTTTALNWFTDDNKTAILSLNVPEPGSIDPVTLKFHPYTIPVELARECAAAFADAVIKMDSINADRLAKAVFS